MRKSTQLLCTQGYQWHKVVRQASAPTSSSIKIKDMTADGRQKAADRKKQKRLDRGWHEDGDATDAKKRKKDKKKKDKKKKDKKKKEKRKS